MAITILYFAVIRETIGRSEECVEPMADTRTVGDLINQLRATGERYVTAFAHLDRVRVSVDLQMADMAAPIGGAREIAFFPPVTGG